MQSLPPRVCRKPIDSFSVVSFLQPVLLPPFLIPVPVGQLSSCLPCKHAGLNCTAAFSLQHHGLGSQHWGRWDPAVRARHHGHRAHLRGAAHRGHHPHHRRRLGSVSALQATATGGDQCQFMVMDLPLDG